MKTTSYFPSKDTVLNGWFQSLDTNIDTYAADLGLSPETVALLKNAATSGMTALDESIAAKLNAASKVAAKNTIIAASESIIRKEVTIIKKLAGYTDAIGAALGIVPLGSPFDPNGYQAEILGAANTAPGGEVTLRFSRAYGNIDGVNVYYRLQGQADFQFIIFHKRSPFVDETPLGQPGVPEVREYRIRATLDDSEIGLFSDPFVLTVA